MHQGRRSFLYTATATFGGIGLIAAGWPFIAQMKPDAATVARSEFTIVDLAKLRSGEQWVARWRGLPVFVVNRKPSTLETMQSEANVRRLVDPRSERRQQPAYAKNWHRSIVPTYGVFVGVCTFCRCVLRYVTEPESSVPEEFICPCCPSSFDLAGRAYSGPARYNLPVPPYEMTGQSQMRIGTNSSDRLFRIESIEML